MTENTAVLEPAVAPVTELAAAPATPGPLVPFTFKIKDFGDVPITMDIARIPEEVQDYLLKNAIKAYVQNRTSTAKSAASKENEPWVRYEAACAADPVQSIVPVPEKEKVVVDYGEIIKSAVKALYENSIGKRDGTGPKKKAERKDPLIAAITRTVIQEVFEKNYALDNNYKYPMASKEVGTDGLAYLRAKMAKNVEAGLATAEQMQFVLETKYLKPARIMLGLDPLTGKAKDAPSIL